MQGHLTGRLLVAAPTLVDPNFRRTVVLMLQHDDEGAVGVVLNRPSTEAVGEHLPAWEESLAAPPVVFVGGPVQPEVAIGLVEGGDGSPVVDGVEVADLAAEPPPGVRARIFSGYAGWGPGQLESELEVDAWIVVDARAQDVFDPAPEGLWPRILRRQKGMVRMLATYPIDPALN